MCRRASLELRYDVIVFENLRFRPPIHTSTISLRTGERIWKSPFSVPEIAGYVWTIAVFEYKGPRNYDTWNIGKILIEPEMLLRINGIWTNVKKSFIFLANSHNIHGESVGSMKSCFVAFTCSTLSKAFQSNPKQFSFHNIQFVPKNSTITSSTISSFRQLGVKQSYCTKLPHYIKGSPHQPIYNICVSFKLGFHSARKTTQTLFIIFNQTSRYGEWHSTLSIMLQAPMPVHERLDCCYLKQGSNNFCHEFTVPINGFLETGRELRLLNK